MHCRGSTLTTYSTHATQGYAYAFHAGYKWDYNQFDFRNLQVAMTALKRLKLADRDDVVLAARHIAYATRGDFCAGKWPVSAAA